MKKILLILLVSGHMRAAQVGLASTRKLLTPLEQLQEKYEKYQGLLIFLDDRFEPCTNSDATSMTFATALIQNVGPIIASASVCRNVIGAYEESFSIKSYANAILVKMGLQKKDKDSSCTLLAHAQFDIKNWIIKEINENLYLLIPHNYLHARGISVSALDERSDNITQLELILGLKVNHMRSISIKEITKKPSSLPFWGQYFVHALENGNLFCEHADYKDSVIPQPVWTWYLTGHGTFKTFIAWMSIADFKKMLDYAATKISMRLLMYSTCYGAGLKNELLYNDEKTNIQKTYPFALVTEAITDAETVAFSYPSDSDTLTPRKRPQNFIEFMKLAQTAGSSYEKIIDCLFHVVPDKYYHGNISQIKLPGIEWFSTMAGKNDVINIGTILAKTRKQPLDIQKFFKATDPKALLLEPSYIPFEIIIDAPRLEYIISMLPGESYIYLASLRSNILQVDRIVTLFTRVKDNTKTFYIPLIVCNDDRGTEQNYTDVLVMPTGVYLKFHDVLYKRSTIMYEEASPQDIADYNNQLKLVKTRFQAQSRYATARATERTEGLLPENISRLQELFKRRGDAAAVGKLAQNKN